MFRRAFAGTLATLVVAVGASGQGYLSFANVDVAGIGMKGGYFIPIYGRDGYTPLVGDRYSAQLLATAFGNDASQLTAVGPILPFSSSAGILAPSPAIQIPGIPGGESALLQLRVWDNEGGRYNTWDSAVVRGASVPFKSLPLSSSKAPVAALGGLSSFRLEPPMEVSDPADFDVRPEFSSIHYFSIGGLCRPSESNYEAVSVGGAWAVVREVSLPCGGIVFYKQGAAGAVPIAITPEPPSQQPPRDEDPFWNVVGMSADGGVVLGNRWPYGNYDAQQAYLGRPELSVPLPLRRALALSANGRFAVGLADSSALVRLDVETHTVVQLAPAPAAGEVGVSAMIGISEDGSVAVWVSGSSDNPRIFRWRAGGGTTELDLGEFIPTVLSGDGRLLAGRRALSPGWWTDSTGFQSLPGTGSVEAVSYDGGVLAGGDSVWTPNGRRYHFVELIRDESVKGLTGAMVVKVSGMSRDGRVLRVEAETARFSPVGPGTLVRVGLALRVAFPGDGPSVEMVRSNDGRPTLRFRGKSAHRYQLYGSHDLEDWTPIGDAVPGANGLMEWALPESGGRSNFHRLRVE